MLMLYSIIAVLIAITIHEFAHAYVADRLGDPTARLEGRMSLNPLAHLDPMGTIALVLVGFGWGKPVPIDPYNLRAPKRDQALIALAGPASNLILVTIISLVYKLTPAGSILNAPAIIQQLISINLSLAFFNLLPIYPLDGSKILIGSLSFEQSEKVEEFLKTNSFPLLIGSLLPIFAGRSIVSLIISPLINGFVRLLA